VEKYFQRTYSNRTARGGGGFLYEVQDEEEQNYFSTESVFLMVPRDPEGFQEFMKRVIEVLEGPIPGSGEMCNNCGFVEKRNHIESAGVI